ncbi:SUMF1/EgtB/PvdO family nonheme iron enzyme [Hyphococcus flavus]|uniref:SUMF1/EgtB/PvdO family nonheme iron enzyme n=1 Tax=Hyphococcus flavus TaxID=1866326 RepID=A0AAE9ZH85_9PROT|nr:SUMF1/EgtB/PvdO family nonheme iron enzyme [Hyphococcus flavus]WDI32747.1 SUMF1/EgtB/PvdO family nonheme iron enzyme [Hyphococcus flavus]
MSAVSIIHAPRDEALGEKIAAALSRAGHAPLRVSPDPSVGDLANDGDDDSTAIVVWTAAASKLVRLHEQARQAMARGALIPVAVGGVRPPGGFEELPPVDLSGWTGALDDPRWRFVLDEIQIAQQRGQVTNGDVWAEPANAEETHTPDEAAPVFAEHSVELDSADTEKVQYAEERRRARARPSRRRFKSRDVAFGATAGLVGMTLVTAVLAPIVLPGDTDSSSQQVTTEPAFPDPSVETPAQLTTLQSASLETNNNASPANASETDDFEMFDLREFGTVPGTDEETETFAAIDPAAAEAEASPTVDDAEIIETETEVPAPSLAPVDPTPIGEESVADSDAMENLVAAISSEESGERAAQNATPQLPEELKETAYLGNYFKECVACPDMAALPGGSFRMGAPAGERGRQPFEGPARVVTIERRFAIGTREVTFDQWQACVEDGGCRAYTPPDHGWGRDKMPVVSVSHADAQAYTAWLSNKTGRNYRLPTEAEWEYAARAGLSAPFAFGGDVTSRRANFNGNYPYRGGESEFRGRTTRVASFPPNAFGLFDMHGNAWEWTSDCWAESHAGAPEDGAARVSGDCSRRVLKGGAWNTGAWRLRSAHRIGKAVSTREFDNGFRVARDLD